MDVIVVAGGEVPLRAALKATTTIPIVIVAIDYDPVALGFVASLGQPGGNVTGLFLQQIELTAKRMELLKAALPKVTQLAVLWEASARDQFKAAEAASRSLDLHIQSLEVRNPPAEFPDAFAMAVKNRTEALFVVTTAVFFRERVRIAQLAISKRLPAMFAQREGAMAQRAGEEARDGRPDGPAHLARRIRAAPPGPPVFPLRARRPAVPIPA